MKFFVKVDASSAERGPFTLEELERKLYGDRALVKPEGGTEWATLGSVKTGAVEGPYRSRSAGVRGGTADDGPPSTDLEAITAERMKDKRRRQVNGGLALIALGVGIAVVTFFVSAASGAGARVYFSLGLFAVGVLQLLRGMKVL